jgi:hypothetical protein
VVNGGQDEEAAAEAVAGQNEAAAEQQEAAEGQSEALQPQADIPQVCHTEMPYLKI